MKTLNESMEWIYGQSPKDGEKYWVSIDNVNGVTIAVAEDSSDTGWMNEYTALDILNVIAYKKLTKPLFKV